MGIVSSWRGPTRNHFGVTARFGTDDDFLLVRRNSKLPLRRFLKPFQSDCRPCVPLKSSAILSSVVRADRRSQRRFGAAASCALSAQFSPRQQKPFLLLSNDLLNRNGDTPLRWTQVHEIRWHGSSRDL